MTKDRIRIAIDFHNLSVAETRVVRTGIQQVVFEILRAQLGLRRKGKTPEVEFIPLPRLPHVVGDTPEAAKWMPVHRNNTPLVIQLTSDELEAPLSEVWNSIVIDSQEVISDEVYFQWLSSCDWLLLTALCEFRHIVNRAGQSNPRLKVAVVQYDLVPVLHPLFCDAGMVNWFNRSWVESIAECADLVFCISRHTAIDSVTLFEKRGFPTERIIATPLPGEVPPPSPPPSDSPLYQRLKLQSGNFFVCLGTLEPRKNLLAAIRGFIKFRSAFAYNAQARETRLVIVGMKGWKDEDERLLGQLGKLADSIVFPCYLERDDIDSLIMGANALIMPSRFEGYGLPISLAHKMGVPTITCVNSSLPEVTQGRSLYVPPDCEDAMAMAMYSTLAMSPRNSMSHEYTRASLEQWEDLLRLWISFMATSSAAAPKLSATAERSLPR